MNTNKTIVILFLPVFVSFFHANPGLGQDDALVASAAYDDALEKELEWLKAETYVITASRVMEKIDKSAASITVITDRQLRQMGAVDLTDAVRRFVPGVLAIPTYWGTRPFSVRGAYGSGYVIYMINGHPVTKMISGDTSLAYDDLEIDNIKRIEFIRGPGSALYGANAYRGVLNVVTKEAEDIDGVELTARRGSWDSQQYNMLFGKAFNELETVFNLNYYDTDGFRGLIQEDLQTAIDRTYPPFIPPASLAPGLTLGSREKFSAALNLKWNGFTLDGKYIDKEFDTPVNQLEILVDRSAISVEDYYITLSYEKRTGNGVRIHPKVYRNANDFVIDTQDFPPGAVLLAPGDIPVFYESGLFRVGKDADERTGIEVEVTGEMGHGHTIVGGAIYERQKASTDISADYLSVSGYIVPLPSLQRWPDSFQLGNRSRNFKAVFLEDIWDLTEDVRMTIGARYDHYSDFEGHFSPRIGLTWQFMTGYDLKLLYGHAFRAPSFLELYQPIGGNPDLDPEIIDTYEVSLGARIISSLTGRATYFLNKKKDIIITSSSMLPWYFINAGRSETQGLELEVKYNFGRGTYVGGNIGFIDQRTPFEMDYNYGKIMANTRLSGYINLYFDFLFINSPSDIIPGETEDAWKDYEMINATLIAGNFTGGLDGLELRASVYNLMDKYNAAYQGIGVPFDLPMQSRNYLFELKYKF